MVPRNRVDAKTVSKSELVPKSKRLRKAFFFIDLATKVTILSIDRRSSERAKRSKAEALRRQLRVIRLTAYLYQRVRVTEQAHSGDLSNSYNPPSKSIHGPRLKWQPPKTPLSPLKAHPYCELNRLIDGQVIKDAARG